MQLIFTIENNKGEIEEQIKENILVINLLKIKVFFIIKEVVMIIWIIIFMFIKKVIFIIKVKKMLEIFSLNIKLFIVL